MKNSPPLIHIRYYTPKLLVIDAQTSAPTLPSESALTSTPHLGSLPEAVYTVPGPAIQ